MANEGYTVETGELASHAQAVQRIAGELGQALSAAEQVTMGVQAYGMICGPLFVPIVLAVSAPGLVTLGLSRQAIGSISDAVTKAVSSYESVEQAHAQALKALGEELR
ncbi:hypothetical protein FNH05_23765 [Amycolatopsis rhizosphaerae]|uniref:ESX-1 secretion-associated protein n=2 Tax=Amycolatopsis rhizosphaerae TaxID=2053003 RepID=A0A558BTG2_9PSEU|nr:hypothetical protein FNH05_23765 [Amycolatopsis rhizosphaerae]